MDSDTESSMANKGVLIVAAVVGLQLLRVLKLVTLDRFQTKGKYKTNNSIIDAALAVF